MVIVFRVLPALLLRRLHRLVLIIIGLAAGPIALPGATAEKVGARLGELGLRLRVLRGLRATDAPCLHCVISIVPRVHRDRP